jgi:hypothetical protein
MPGAARFGRICGRIAVARENQNPWRVYRQNRAASPTRWDADAVPLGVGDKTMSSPNSPDLDPELAAGLLESLTSWDPRASVPLALAYMRCGDEAALEGFDALALGSPVAREMLEDRYLSPLPDRKHLASLPQGSLGRELSATWPTTISTRTCCASRPSSRRTRPGETTSATWPSAASNSTIYSTS